MSSSVSRGSHALSAAAPVTLHPSTRDGRRAMLPSLPTAHVPRAHLYRAIDGALHKTLAVLSAPAGAGKTTLLAEWAHERPHIAIHWISLLHCHSDQVIDRLPPLAVSTPTLIVIDNAHLLAPDVAQRLAELMLASCAQLHWLLAGRGVPDIRLSHFAMNDRLWRIDADLLRADADFVLRLARARSIANFNRGRAEQLCARTEGWLAGIRLALSAADASALDTAIDPNACTYDYFADLLHQQPDHVRRWLLACSIVEHFDDTLATELADAVAAVSMQRDPPLESFLRAELFIRKTPAPNGAYAFQRNFLAFLRYCAQHELSGRLGDLHQRASRWYADNKRHEEALPHAFACNDSVWRLDLLGVATRHLLKTGAVDQCLHWTSRLSRGELFSREALWTSHIVALILARRFAPAQSLLRDAVDKHAVGALSGAHLSNKLRTLQLMLTLLSERTAAPNTPVDAPSDAHDAQDGYLTGTLLSLQAYGLLQAQCFDPARRRAHQARDLLLSQGSHYGATHANAILCGALAMLGQFQATVRECESMFQVVASGPRTTGWATAAITLAQIRYEQNQLAEAEALCHQALPSLTTASTLPVFAAGNVLVARIFGATARADDAWRVLDDLHGYLEAHHSQFLTAQVAYEKIWLTVAHPKFSAAAIVREFRLDALESAGTWRSRHSNDADAAAVPKPLDASLARLGQAQALRLLALGEHDRCQAIVASLTENAQGIGFVQRRMQLEALRAVSFARNRQDAPATDALKRALALTDGVGFTRAVLDEVPGLAALLAAAAQRATIRDALPERYFERFADCFGGRTSMPRAFARRGLAIDRSAAPEPLTERERAVLELLAQGLSNQQICERANVAITTTKWHLRNIFSKLNVNTRTAALARARALQLID